VAVRLRTVGVLGMDGAGQLKGVPGGPGGTAAVASGGGALQGPLVVGPAGAGLDDAQVGDGVGALAMGAPQEAVEFEVGPWSSRRASRCPMV